ncbi:MAG: flavodoxin [Ferrimonas sp.]
MSMVCLLVGSVYGGAESVAEELQAQIRAAGHEITPIVNLTDSTWDTLDGNTLLVITSTTGAGDLPDNIACVFQQLKNQAPTLAHSQYGVIALGDSSYGETFCGAGRQFDELLQELGAKRCGEVLMVDACETMEPEQPAKVWLQGWLAALKSE